MIRDNVVIGLSAGTLLAVVIGAVTLGTRLERISQYMGQAITVGDHREWQRDTVALSPAWTAADMDAIHDRRHGRIEGFR